MALRIVSALLLCGLATAPAAAASISSGTVFDGGPAFLLEADGYPVGTGIVPDAATDYLFSYTVDDAVLAAAATVRVRFVNDLFDPGVADRNLRVISLSVNGRVFRGEALATFGPEGPSDRPGELPGTSYEVRIERPAEGWPAR